MRQRVIGGPVEKIVLLRSEMEQQGSPKEEFEKREVPRLGGVGGRMDNSSDGEGL